MQSKIISLLLLVTSSVTSVAAAQIFGGVSIDIATVPAEFRFLYEGSIRSGQLLATWAALPYDRIILERSRCMVPCPAYKVTLHRGAPSGQGETYEDRFGLAELSAIVPVANNRYVEFFPERSGEFVGKVDIWTYARLSYLLRKMDFERMSGRYAANRTDQRTITVTAASNANTKTAAEYGAVGPIELWSIQEAIDSVAKGIVWTPK